MTEPQPQLENQPPSKRWLFWPALVIALLGGHTLLLTFAATKAIGAGTRTVPSYGRADADWDQAQQQLRASEALGWIVTLDAEREADTRGQRMVTVSLTEAQGDPIPGAQLKLTYFHQAEGTEHEATEFQSQADGTYTTFTTLRNSGFHEFQLVVESGDQVYRKKWQQFIW